MTTQSNNINTPPVSPLTSHVSQFPSHDSRLTSHDSHFPSHLSPLKSSEPLVIVEGLSKKFCKDLKTSLWYGVRDLFSAFTGNRDERVLRDKEFWAVKDISFELRRGECLGLIGHNGAGKSTLLKILNGLINPDAGKVTIKGRVGALIELGAGFNPILTGRENIYNNGAVLGFTRKEINDKLDLIIDFAELREFIDMPVQNYSSGMKVRLGFAVAAQMEPDVLIIDEVLAVGDLGFVLKCFKQIDTILPRTAMIFVSHNMPMVSRICTKIILMEHGKSQFQGDEVGKAIDLYYTRFAENETNVVFDDGSIVLEKVELLNARGHIKGVPQLNWGDDLILSLRFRTNREIQAPQFTFNIFDKEQRPVAMLEQNKNSLSVKENVISFEIKHAKAQLSKGIYSINLTATPHNSTAPLIRMNGILVFQVTHEQEIWQPFLLEAEYSNSKL